uniref:Tetratricopeptide repeat protein 29 n=1 Tax=Anopheles farauti TaxID=69004 RepID=A0A182QYS8_9DIPT
MSTEELVRPGLTTPFTGQLADIKRRLRKKVPQLTANDVRRARIRYYEAITSELYEAGYKNAAIFVLHLIAYEDTYVGRTSVQSVEEKRLRYNEPLLSYLCERLTEAESCRKEQSYEREVHVLLAVGRKLTPEREKHWLAQQFFLVALDRCIDCGSSSVRVKTESLVRYYYAELLFSQQEQLSALKMVEKAKAALDAVVSGVRVVDEWKTLDNEPQCLPIAINTMRFKINHRISYKRVELPAWMREQYMKDAYQAALETYKPSTKAEACLAFGEFLCNEKRYPEAMDMYRDALQQAELEGDLPELVCAAVLAQAETYDKLGQPVRRDALMQRADQLTRSRQDTLCRANYWYLSIYLETANGYPEDIDRLVQMEEQLGKAFKIYTREQDYLKKVLVFGMQMQLSARIKFRRCIQLTRAAISTSDEELYRLGDMFDR